MVGSRLWEGLGEGVVFEAVFCTYQIKIFSQSCVLDVKFASRSIVMAALGSLGVSGDRCNRGAARVLRLVYLTITLSHGQDTQMKRVLCEIKVYN